MNMAPIAKLERHLLSLLKEQGREISRPELARLLGKRVVNPHDKATLERLANQGLIEVIEKPVGPVKVEYYYKAI
jgi:predicted transcriptional regulator